MDRTGRREFQHPLNHLFLSNRWTGEGNVGTSALHPLRNSEQRTVTKNTLHVVEFVSQTFFTWFPLIKTHLFPCYPAMPHFSCPEQYVKWVGSAMAKPGTCSPTRQCTNTLHPAAWSQTDVHVNERGSPYPAPHGGWCSAAGGQTGPECPGNGRVFQKWLYNSEASA